MGNEKKILGHIDCPYCGFKNGMRIQHDKHGAPFGFCEANCDGQLRIGGKQRRVDAFLKLHPHLQPEPEKPPVTVTEPKAQPEPVKETAPPKPVVKPSTEFKLEF